MVIAFFQAFFQHYDYFLYIFERKIEKTCQETTRGGKVIKGNSKKGISMKKNCFILVIVSIMILSVSCVSTSTTRVKRVSANTQIDLTGEWNDTDVHIVCADLLEECLDSVRLRTFEIQNGRLPLLIVGSFRNDSDEHIDTSIISKKMQNAIINSGRADFMASSEQRAETRAEILSQQAWSNQDVAKTIANEDAADFMLQGSVKTIVQKNGKQSVRTYFVYCELIDIESGRVIWTGENDEIKKVISEASYRW